jgi:zinc/manganese transport system permease protein
MSAHLWMLAPALALGLGLLALAPLGAQVLRRGVVFIDLAVAQAAAAAALAAAAWVDHPGWLLTQAAALAGALMAAAVVAGLARWRPAQREALIGLVYVATACAALLTARSDPHGRERLAELLAADVLWAGWPQVAVLAACTAAVLALRRGLARDAVFFPLFAAVTSLAVPVLGLFLVFALLIAPALGPLRRGGLVGGVAAAAGLAGSWAWDAPSGACVALALALAGLGTALLAPRHSAA